MAAPIRVVLAAGSSMEALIMDGALAQPGIEVVRTVVGTGDAPVAEAVREHGANVVIASVAVSGIARDCYELIRSRAAVRVLAVAVLGRGADLFELRPLGTNVGSGDLAAAIRAAVRPREPAI
ncbi:MAG TPA: hypothetical protein VGA02_00145 [Gemmatimonadales bacterium]